MVFLTEQTNQKFQISHVGIIWKDKRSIKTEEQNSFFFWIADRRMEGNMSDLQVGPDNISTAFEDG